MIDFILNLETSFFVHTGLTDLDLYTRSKECSTFLAYTNLNITLSKAAFYFLINNTVDLNTLGLPHYKYNTTFTNIIIHS